MLAGLDPEQRAAVTAPAGPVCILAGAGTGKTRAITHRIAYRALTGEIEPRHVLAVTFTARAAAEMRARLAALGAAGVQARTFHAAALRQLRYFAPRLLERPGRCPSCWRARRGWSPWPRPGPACAPTAPAARDLAGEIEWAKSSPGRAGRLRRSPRPRRCASRRTSRPRWPRSSPRTSSSSARQGVIDFEDMLRAAVWGIEEHPDVAEQIRAQYRHFVVDEYQDVNPLQQRLLEAWLGGRDDLTVVGDASQTIYSFTGATSSYLIDFPRRRRGARRWSGWSATTAPRRRWSGWPTR